MKAQLSRDEYMKIREEVLATWPTGRGLTLEEGIRYQQNIPEEKNFAAAMKQAREKKEALLQPRAGVAGIDEHIQLLKFLESDGEADLLPTTIDAYTRQNRYKEAQKGIEKSIADGHSLLNGFPAVNHGPEGCRRVVESVSKPIQVRHGTPDARLLAEITLASGFTSFEGGGISYNIPYAKKVPLEKSIEDWQYVDRLAGIYQEEGVTINREPFGPLTGTLVPPCIGNAVGVLEGLLALEQGVRSITLGYGQSGCLIQDVAAVISLRILAEKYFNDQGHNSYDLTTVFHQWMGGFPIDEAKAFSVICWGGIAGIFAGADKIIVKTPHEARGIPTGEANAEGLRATRQIIQMLKDQHLTEGEHLRDEVDLIIEEASAILDRTISLGEGSIARGAAAAFEAGIIDIPFAPSQYNRGKVLPVRDNDGFIRILDAGDLPFSDSITSYHQKRLEERAKAEGRKVTFQMVRDDIYAISKGRLVGRPR